MIASLACTGQHAALAMESLRCAGRLRLRVRGQSMLPTIWPDDIAEIEACALEDVASGDIVLASRDGRFFLHRFVTSCEGGFSARGDSMPGPDPTYPADALLGKLLRIERAGKIVRPSGLGPLTRVLGYLFCHSARLRNLALRLRPLMNSRPAPRLAVNDLTAGCGDREAR